MTKKIVLLLILGYSFCNIKFCNPEISNQKVENFYAFGKVYGYVRYFYPSDEASNINWDAFSIYGLKQVENCKDNEELTARLKMLFKTVAPLLQFSNKNYSKDSLPIFHFTRPVYWQYLGLPNGEPNSIYKSVRINGAQSNLTHQSANAGAISQAIIQNYRGKSFVLSTEIRNTSSISGFLFAQTTNSKGDQLQIDTVNFHKKDGIDNWRKCSIKGIFDPNVQNLKYGIQIKGNGVLNADKFTLSVNIDNKWHDIPLDNGSFEKIQDTGTNIPSWQTLPGIFHYQIDNTISFDGKRSLQFTNLDSTKLFETEPDNNHSIISKINNNLYVIFPIVLNSVSNHTLPRVDGQRINVLNESIAHAIVDQTQINKYVYISDIISIWNIIKHFYPYNDELDMAHWDDDLKKSLREVLLDSSEHAFKTTALSLLSNTNDGHASIVKTFSESSQYSIPLKVIMINGRIIIRSVNDSLAKIGFNPGDVITKINDTSALLYLQNKEKYISGSAQWKNYMAGQTLFDGEKNSKIKLDIISDAYLGQSKTINFVRSNWNSGYSSVNSVNQVISPDVLYVNLCKTELKDDFIVRLNLMKYSKIIFDLRGYPKGNLDNLLSHLINHKDNIRWLFMPEIIYPDYLNVNYFISGWNLEPIIPKIEAKIIFLCDARSISSTESVLNFIKYYKLGLLVGQKTAGANGNINTIRLLSGYYFSFSGLKVRGLDGSKLQGLGISPDINVNISLDNIRKSEDIVLKTAINQIEK